MKKADFIKAVALNANLSQETVSKALTAMIDTITNELKRGNEVGITGFGTFKVSARSERNGVNPKTGETIKIPAMNVPTFKAGKTFKDEIK